MGRAQRAERLKRGDRIILAGAAGAMLLPIPAASAAAITGAVLWILVTTPPPSDLRRAAFIFAAITASLLWGRLLLAMGSETFLAFDGWLVALVAGTQGTGNMIAFRGDGAGVFMVAPGCSSLQGMSLVLVLWVTITQSFRIVIGPRALATLLVAVAAAIAINVLRMAAIATWPAHFHTLHVGWGAAMFGWATLAAIVVVMLVGFRDAVAGAR